MSFKPIIVDTGYLKQLPPGEALDAGGWTLPTVGGTEGYALIANVSGNAIWAKFNHGDLTGLGDNDHPHYVMYTGATDDVDLGAYNLTTTGTITANVHTDGTASLTGGSLTDVKLGSLTTNGYVTTTSNDGTLAVVTSIDHGSLSGLSDNDHPQYHLKTGWDSDYAQTALTTITVDDANTTLSIAPTGANFEFWVEGIKYTKTTQQDVVFTDTEGLWYFYFDNTGTLTTSQTPWDIKTNNWAGVCTGYWDATNNALILIGPEYHSYWMDPTTLEYLQNAIGTRWASGLGVAINGDNLDIGSGHIYAADIDINITDGVGGNIWEQDLTPASLPIFYRTGSGEWRKFSASTTPVYLDANIPQVNILSGTWGWSPVDIDKYFVYWVIATNDQSDPVMLVPGQEEGSTLTEARDGNKLSDMFFGNLPPEAKVVARVIMQRVVGSPYYSLIEINDYRNISDEPSSGGSVVGDHGNLTGLGENDHPHYVMYTGATANVDLGSYTLTTTGTISASNLPVPSTANEVLVSTGANTAAWTTDLTGLTSLTVDNITIDAATITSDTGAISFDNENLSTTGTIVGSNIPSPTVDDQVLISTAAGIAAWSTAGTNQLLGSDGAGVVAWESKSFGYNIPANTTANQVYVGTGVGTAAWTTDLVGLSSLNVDNITIDAAAITSDTGTVGFGSDQVWTTGQFTGGKSVIDNITIDAATITSDTGAISFNNENLSTTGTVVGSNIPSPTVDDQVLISTAAGISAWSTANANQLLGSDGAGAVAWEAKSFGFNIPANSTANQVYVGTGVGTAAWTTDLAGLTSLTVDNITINGAVISSNTGAISFSNENLTTTGSLTANSLTSTYATMYLDGAGTGYSGVHNHYTSNASITGTLVIDLPGGFQGTMLSLRFLGYNYSSGRGAWGALVGGYTYTAQGRWLQTHASIQGNPPFETIRLGWNGNTNKACIMLGITSTTWAYPTFTIESLTAGLSAQTAYQSGWAVNFYTDESLFFNQPGYYDPVTVEIYRDIKSPTTTGQIPVSTGTTGAVSWEAKPFGYNIPANTAINQIYVGTGVGTAAWTTDLAGLTSLTVDNITINGSTISSSIGTIFFDNEDLTTTGIITGGQLKVDNISIDGATIASTSGAISFSNENVSTTGTMVGSNIPSPSVDNQVLISTAANIAAWSTAGTYQYLASDADGEVAWVDKVWTKSLTSSVTVYLRTTGSDITGDGSIGAPYLTLAKVIEVIGHWHIGTHFITVDIGEGIFNESDSSKFYHLYGNQVIFKGVSEKITGQVTNSISASSTSMHSNLSYYDVTFILPVGKSVSVGDYIAVRDVSGGTNPEGLYGCHYVSTWDSGTRTATVRVVFRDGSTKASGVVTCTISLIKTVIAYDNTPGIEAVSGYSAGHWYGMVIEGNYNPTTKTAALFGVWSNFGSSISLGGSDDSGEALGVVGFNIGLYSHNNSCVLASKSFVSNCAGVCVYALNSSNIDVDDCRISGSNFQAIYANMNCSISANSVKIVASGDNTIYADNFSYILATNSWVGLNNATYSMYADNMSGIEGTGATISPASVVPAVDGNNDGSRIIGQ